MNEISGRGGNQHLVPDHKANHYWRLKETGEEAGSFSYVQIHSQGNLTGIVEG
jgi:hypothetical protein